MQVKWSLLVSHLILIAYATTYFTLVSPNSTYIFVGKTTLESPILVNGVWEADYHRIPRFIPRAIFAPINAFDRHWLRRAYWNPKFQPPESSGIHRLSPLEMTSPPSVGQR